MPHLGFVSAHLELYLGAGLAGHGGTRGAGHGDADLDNVEKTIISKHYQGKSSPGSRPLDTPSLGAGDRPQC